MGRAPAFGYFGKLPCTGDFLRQGLTPGFVAAWDGWLQEVMVAGAIETGSDGWPEAFLNAPIWRFSVAPGLCGPDGAVGILMPSVDRVGRCFPFTLAAETSLPFSETIMAFQPVLEHLEATAKAMLGDDASRTALDAALAALPAALDTSKAIAVGGGAGSLWITASQPCARVMICPALPCTPYDVRTLFGLSNSKQAHADPQSSEA